MSHAYNMWNIHLQIYLRVRDLCITDFSIDDAKNILSKAFAEVLRPYEVEAIEPYTTSHEHAVNVVAYFVKQKMNWKKLEEQYERARVDRAYTTKQF